MLALDRDEFQLVGDQAYETRHGIIAEHMGTLAHCQERLVLLLRVGELLINVSRDLRECAERRQWGVPVSAMGALKIWPRSRLAPCAAAPIATGWSDSCRVGLAPTGRPCLCTAH